MTIFRLYLINKLKEGTENIDGKTPRGFIERRKNKRFSVKDKKILASNQDDLLLINNISKEGFNTETNERTFSRLKVGEVYACKIRYRKENYVCEAEVRWKEKLSVGFSIKNPDSSISHFMTRLTLPHQISETIEKIEEKKILEKLIPNINWYTGEQETHIVMQKIGGYLKWLIKTKEFLIYYDLKELKAAKEERPLSPDILNFFFSNPDSVMFFQAKKDHITFVEDIVMASDIENKEEILEHLAESKHSEVRLFKVKN